MKTLTPFQLYILAMLSIERDRNQGGTLRIADVHIGGGFYEKAIWISYGPSPDERKTLRVEDVYEGNVRCLLDMGLLQRIETLHGHGYVLSVNGIQAVSAALKSASDLIQLETVKPLPTPPKTGEA